MCLTADVYPSATVMVLVENGKGCSDDVDEVKIAHKLVLRSESMSIRTLDIFWESSIRGNREGEGK